MTPTGLIILTTLILAPAGRPALLAGPKVTPEAATGGASVFSAAARPRPAEIGPRQWQRLLRQIDVDGEQRAAIQGIVGEFRQASEAFRAAHGERLETLAREARAAQEAGRVPPQDTRLELRELRDRRPKGADYLKRIWSLLDGQQRQQLRNLLTETRQKRAPRTSG